MRINHCQLCGNPMFSFYTFSSPIVCDNCKTNGAPKCLYCGDELHIMDTSLRVDEEKGSDSIILEVLFHCHTCGQDYEKSQKFIGQNIRFDKKYWG